MDREGRRQRGEPGSAAEEMRLLAAPAGPIAAPPERRGDDELERLRLPSGREALRFVPAAGGALPLVVALHGAGADARQGLGLLLEQARELHFMVLAPSSAGASWDLIEGRCGPDVQALDLALGDTFGSHAVAKDRLAVAGFSDGASYALSLGLSNGDLFTHIIAFSPGFLAPAAHRGRPKVYVSHGDSDPVLPIDPTSRRIVPLLRQARYEVRYREFDGGHVVPQEARAEAARWFLGAPPADRRGAGPGSAG